MKKLSLSFLNCAGDLGHVFSDGGYSYDRGIDLSCLIKQAPVGGAVFALADKYPVAALAVDDKTLRMAEEKNIRLFIEYPKSVDGLSIKTVRAIAHERAVVACDDLGLLKRDSIFMPCGTFFLDCEIDAAPMITLAKVAGYDRLAFGLPEKTYPLLFAHPRYHNVLIATGCLSSIIKARARPAASYRELWRALMKWAGFMDIDIDWIPNTGPAYGPDAALPDGAPELAFQRGVRWFLDNMIFRVEANTEMFIDHPGGDAPHLDEVSLGSLMGGVLEGYESCVDHNGRQRIRNIQRGDCIAETSMVMALDAAATGSPETRKAAIDLADYVFSNAFFQNDPESPMYALSNWCANLPVFYADDNARVIMGVLLTRSLLGVSRWDERILRCALANLRTSAKTGFRHNSLRASSFEHKNWTDYAADETLTLLSPHYQCYIWAVYLWMYALTGYEPFLSKPRTALGKCMASYPDGWQWTNSLTAEMARILLPLAFLVRVDDTPEHREWLALTAQDVIKLIEPCGAVRDMFGELSMGTYPPPQSNDSYGTTEASLIQQNGDTATDLLYTANWAFIGLHEASLVLDDKPIKDACGRMAEFFCRIQIASKEHPYLDGCWMRGFDFAKWEYWGSSADTDWGAWCVESGWINTWICTAMILHRRGESLFNLSAKKDFEIIARDIIHEMETDNTRGRLEAAQ